METSKPVLNVNSIISSSEGPPTNIFVPSVLNAIPLGPESGTGKLSTNVTLANTSELVNKSRSVSSFFKQIYIRVNQIKLELIINL